MPYMTQLSFRMTEGEGGLAAAESYKGPNEEQKI